MLVNLFHISIPPPLGIFSLAIKINFCLLADDIVCFKFNCFLLHVKFIKNGEIDSAFQKLKEWYPQVLKVGLLDIPLI